MRLYSPYTSSHCHAWRKGMPLQCGWHACGYMTHHTQLSSLCACFCMQHTPNFLNICMSHMVGGVTCTQLLHRGFFRALHPCVGSPRLHKLAPTSARRSSCSTVVTVTFVYPTSRNPKSKTLKPNWRRLFFSPHIRTAQLSPTLPWRAHVGICTWC